jgi:hypothetical protein
VQAEPEPAVRTLLQAGAFDFALTEATVVGGDRISCCMPSRRARGPPRGRAR